MNPDVNTRTEGFIEDAHGDEAEVIDEEELNKLKELKDLKKQYRDAFNRLDTNGDGFVSLEEISHYITDDDEEAAQKSPRRLDVFFIHDIFIIIDSMNIIIYVYAHSATGSDRSSCRPTPNSGIRTTSASTRLRLRNRY